MTTTTEHKTKTAPGAMLEWQYMVLLGELQQVQLHAADPNCPCSQHDIGEYCLPKHSLNVATVAAETAAMDPVRSELLFDLAESATELHKNLKASVCGHGRDQDVVEWSRTWRKKIEAIYYSCQVAMRQPAVVKVTGKCDAGKSCSFKVRGETVKTTTALSIKDLPDAIQRMSRAEPAKITTTAIGPTGTRYEFRYRLVEAGNLVVSNDPFNFTPNPLYPQELQPRMRGRAATQLQVEKLAATLDPEALLLDFQSLDRGAPIVGPDLVVESGNGRTMAVIRAAKDHPEVYDRYRKALIVVGPKYGFDEKQISGLTTPVLVRERITQIERRAFAEEANSAPILESSPIEKARTDADKVTPEMLASLEVGDQAIEDALRSPANRQFAQAFLAKLPQNEQARLVDSKGQLNQDGVRRMAMALFIRALPGENGLKLAEKFFESTDPAVRNVFNGIAGALGLLARSELLASSGQRDQGYTIGDDLARAVAVYAAVKKTSGQTVEKYLSQLQLTERELTPFQETVLKTIDENARSGKRIAAILRRYAELVIQSPPQAQVSFMPEAHASKEQLWQLAAQAVSMSAPAGSVCDYLLKGMDTCNLTPTELNALCTWRPLREYIIWARSAGKVKICAVGLVPGAYQLAINDLSRTAQAEAAGKIKTVPHARRVYTPYAELVYEIMLPHDTEQSLWKPQEVERPRGERGEQTTMIQPHWPIRTVCHALDGALGDETGASSIYREIASQARGAHFPKGDVDRLNTISRTEEDHHTVISGIIKRNCSVHSPGNDERELVLADPVLAAIAAKIGLLDPGKPAHKCKLVGKNYHCQLEAKQHFDPRSFRTVKTAPHGTPLPPGIAVVIGCPKRQWEPGAGCKVSMRGQHITYSKEACRQHEGCKVS